METQTKASVKDVFINLGAIIALYTLVVSLVNLLFTVINHAFPQVTNGYAYMDSGSISWPVATLIIVFPIFILLMWLLEKEFIAFPEKQSMGIHKWLSYLTLFITGLVMAGDLIMVIYYFIDGRELSTAFLLKVFVLLVIIGALFSYYLSDVRGKLTSKSRKIYRVAAFIIVVGSIVWGFTVLGSPQTQRLFKYDTQKVNDLMNLNGAIENYYSIKGVLPKDFTELSAVNYDMAISDVQTQKPYEYIVKSNVSYELCAEFNKASDENITSNQAYLYGGSSWTHPAGKHCFPRSVNPNTSPNEKYLR